MIELRKDYILERWSYIALDRKNRLKQFSQNSNSENNDACFFCPGNENMTPPEIGRMVEKEGWKIRWFPNKFPITDVSDPNLSEQSKKYFEKKSAFGFHEVIAETPIHEKQLWDLDESHISELFKVYSERIDELSSKKNIKYVQLFKNSGGEAGTSIIHTHTQIVAMNMVPPAICEKLDSIKKYEKCPYCEIIALESKSDRLVFENEDFIAFTPFAPRFNFEISVFPKKHLKKLSDIEQSAYKNIAAIFKKILLKLKSLNSPYNFYLHCSPENENLHFHFEITPRLNKWAGFELATNSYVITTSPEEAAKFYAADQSNTI